MKFILKKKCDFCMFYTNNFLWKPWIVLDWIVLKWKTKEYSVKCTLYLPFFYLHFLPFPSDFLNKRSYFYIKYVLFLPKNTTIKVQACRSVLIFFVHSYCGFWVYSNFSAERLTGKSVQIDNDNWEWFWTWYIWKLKLYATYAIKIV